jgi:hypothetical protein
MSFFSPSFLVLVRHSAESALYLVFLLAIAFGLSFLEDWFKALHRPPILINGVHYALVVALLVDLAAWGLLLAIGMYRLFAKLITRDEEHADQVRV